MFVTNVTLVDKTSTTVNPHVLVGTMKKSPETRFDVDVVVIVVGGLVLK
jgi:hypothetical protein